MIGRPPRSPLFPYTTLSRSGGGALLPGGAARLRAGAGGGAEGDRLGRRLPRRARGQRREHRSERSEEHTSELQSRQYLVCRLLLAKKNSPVLYMSTTSSYIC